MTCHEQLTITLKPQRRKLDGTFDGQIILIIIKSTNNFIITAAETAEVLNTSVGFAIAEQNTEMLYITELNGN